MSEKTSLLEHTDRFLKAKRNLLFWLSALILLEFAHTNKPISPSIFGAGVEVYPRLLITLIWLATAYHFVGFWYERSLVTRRNSHLTIGKSAEQIDDHLRIMLEDLHGFSRPGNENIRLIKDTLIRQDSEKSDLMREKLAITLNLRSVIFTINKVEGYINQMSLSQPPEESIKVIKGVISEFRQEGPEIHYVPPEEIVIPDYQPIFESLDASDQVLSNAVKDATNNIIQLSERISNAERNMFSYYDYVVPFGLFVFGTLIWLYDLGPWPSPAALLKALLT